MSAVPTAKRHQPFRVPLRRPRLRFEYKPRAQPSQSDCLDFGRRSVTVCSAAICRWIYDPAKEDYGSAIVAFSDRMLTDEGLGIEYQPGKWKAAITSDGRRVILVSGPFVVHSELLRRLFDVLKSPYFVASSEAAPHNATRKLAEMYAELLRDYKREQASHLFLAPLSLDKNDRFLRQQRTLDPSLVAAVADQLQTHKIPGNPEALILGCEDKNAHIYHVDRDGLVTAHDDIGFASIGNGGIHASAHFMRREHVATAWYWKTLFTAFAAKKRAEVAPGVGDKTDMFLVTRNGVDKMPEDMMEEFEKRYKARQAAAKEADDNEAIDLSEFFGAKASQQHPQPSVPDPESSDPSSSA